MGNIFWAFKKSLSICYNTWENLQKIKNTCLFFFMKLLMKMHNLNFKFYKNVINFVRI